MEKLRLLLITFRLVVQTQKFLLIDERAIALWDSGWERRDLTIINGCLQRIPPFFEPLTVELPVLFEDRFDSFVHI